MSRGLICDSRSQPSPSLSKASGRRFSSTTSAFATIRSKIARPSSSFRFSVMLFLLRLARNSAMLRACGMYGHTTPSAVKTSHSRCKTCSAADSTPMAART